MELRQFRHFVALAELGSFTAAARREHIVQSGLSNSVQALEREVGAELYVRGSRPIRLTPAGHALVEPARRALHAARSAVEAVHDIQDVITGQLRIGVVGSARHLVHFADHVSEFAARHPAVDIRLLQAPVAEMLRMVGAGELDCAVVAAPSAVTSGVRLTTLASEPLVLLCRDDHRLARADTVHVGELADERFVDVGQGWSARAMVDVALATAGITRRVACEVNEWELFIELVASGLGIGFIPEGLAIQASTPRAARLRIVPVENLKIQRHIQLALPRISDLTPAARHFTDHLHAHRPAARQGARDPTG